MDFSLSPPQKVTVSNGSITIDTITIHREFTTFSYRNSAKAERNKLKKMQLFLRRMKTQNDSINGVKIHFGQADYEVFIDVLDVLAIEDMPSYFMDGNNIYAFIVPPKPVNRKLLPLPPIIRCGTGVLMAQEQALIRAEKQSQLEKEIVVAFSKNHWMVWAAFIGLMGLNAFKLNRFRKSNSLQIN